MAYIPPFKRSSKNNQRPCPKPESLDHEFRKKMNLNPAVKYICANQSIWRWFPIGLTEETQFPSNLKLERISMESNSQNAVENSFVLMNNQSIEGNNEKDLAEPLWDLIAVNILHDLLPSFENVKNSIGIENHVKIEPKFVARLGKVHFHGHSTSRKPSIDEAELQKVKRHFHTNVSRSYIDNIAQKFASMSNFIYEEKNLYLIRLFDAKNPGETLSCKCREIAGSRTLQLGKIYLYDIRQMVVDISCLNKKMDLRLFLSRKRRLIKLTDEEEEGIRDIVSSAVIDSDVKGGLRRPIGNSSFGNRFRVSSFCKESAKIYRSSCFRLKLKHVERFDLTTMTLEGPADEITLILNGLVSELMVGNAETDELLKNVKANLEFIWENLFCPDSSPI